MIERGPLFNTPTFRWIPAGGTVEVHYRFVLSPASAAPDELN
jgi:hypothetical protein